LAEDKGELRGGNKVPLFAVWHSQSWLCFEPACREISSIYFSEVVTKSTARQASFVRSDALAQDPSERNTFENPSNEQRSPPNSFEFETRFEYYSIIQ